MIRKSEKADASAKSKAWNEMIKCLKFAQSVGELAYPAGGFAAGAITSMAPANDLSPHFSFRCAAFNTNFCLVTQHDNAALRN